MLRSWGQGSLLVDFDRRLALHPEEAAIGAGVLAWSGSVLAVARPAGEGHGTLVSLYTLER